MLTPASTAAAAAAPSRTRSEIRRKAQKERFPRPRISLRSRMHRPRHDCWQSEQHMGTKLIRRLPLGAATNLYKLQRRGAGANNYDKIAHFGIQAFIYSLAGHQRRDGLTREIGAISLFARPGIHTIRPTAKYRQTIRTTPTNRRTDNLAA